MINSINKIRTRKVIRRLPNDPLNVFAHGLEIKIDIDLSNLRENQVTLFSAVLHNQNLMFFLSTFRFFISGFPPTRE